MIALAVNPRQHIQTAHDAGKSGSPSPKRASRHNYQQAEQDAWEQGMYERCNEQYQDLEK